MKSIYVFTSLLKNKVDCYWGRGVPNIELWIKEIWICDLFVRFWQMQEFIPGNMFFFFRQILSIIVENFWRDSWQNVALYKSVQRTMSEIEAELPLSSSSNCPFNPTFATIWPAKVSSSKTLNPCQLQKLLCSCPSAFDLPGIAQVEKNISTEISKVPVLLHYMIINP